MLERLGSGGAATVFLCEDEVLEREVAVKVLHSGDEPEQRRRFRREARLGASLSHPNLVSVYDTIEEPDGELIVMEYVAGPTLAELIADGPIAPQRTVEILADVAAALDYAHEKGIVHRDVKPGNVLIAPDGTAKVADLGIASASHLTQTTTGAKIAGTLAYMAPERLEGKASGSAADIYALGAVAFEMLSGQRARRATTPAEAVSEAIAADPPDLVAAWPDAPHEAADAIQDAMRAEPEQRPRRAGLFVDRLDGALDTGVTTATTLAAGAAPLAAEAAPPATAELDPVGGRGRGRWLAVAAGVAMLLGGFALAATLGGSSSEPPSRATAKAEKKAHQKPPEPTTVTETATVPVATTVTAPEPKPKPKPEPKPKPKPKPEPPKPPKPPDEHAPPGQDGGAFVPPGQEKKGEGG